MDISAAKELLRRLAESFNDVSNEDVKKVTIKYVFHYGYAPGSYDYHNNNGTSYRGSPTAAEIYRILSQQSDLTEYKCSDEDYRKVRDYIDRLEPSGAYADYEQKIKDVWSKSRLEKSDLSMLASSVNKYVRQKDYEERQIEKQQRKEQHDLAVSSDSNVWAGEVGDTVKFKVRTAENVDRRSYGYGYSSVEYNIWDITDIDGRHFSWGDSTGKTVKPGNIITGKIKKLNEFKGIKSTQLTRVTVEEKGKGFFESLDGCCDEDMESNFGLTRDSEPVSCVSFYAYNDIEGDGGDMIDCCIYDDEDGRYIGELDNGETTDLFDSKAEVVQAAKQLLLKHHRHVIQDDDTTIGDNFYCCDDIKKLIGDNNEVYMGSCNDPEADCDDYLQTDFFASANPEQDNYCLVSRWAQMNLDLEDSNDETLYFDSIEDLIKYVMSLQLQDSSFGIGITENLIVNEENLDETYSDEELDALVGKTFNQQKIENIYRRQKYNDKRLFAKTKCINCGREKRVFLSNLINDPKKYGSCICSTKNLESRLDNIKDLYSGKKKLSSNTSGFTGVSYVKTYKGELYDKWRAYIDVDGKRIYLGDFDSKAKAVRARKAAGQKGIKWYKEHKNQFMKDARKKAKRYKKK